MAAPEFSEGAPIWQQLGYGLAIGVAAFGWLINQIIKGRSDAKTEPKHLMLERAELADMQPVRDMVRQWGDTMRKLDELAEARADIEETKRASEVIREKLERIERRLEIDAAVRDDRLRRGGHEL